MYICTTTSLSIHLSLYRVEKVRREKQISHIKAYIWNLEKRYWWTYLQGRNRDTGIENRFLGTAGEGEGGTNQESIIETYILLYVKQLVGSCCITGSSALCSVTTQRGGMGSEERWRLKREGACVYLWLIHLLYGRNQHNSCKAIILQLKKNFKYCWMLEIQVQIVIFPCLEELRV